MFIVKFLTDTDLVLAQPPYGVYFEKGEEIKATSYKKGTGVDSDMVYVQTRDYGELVIFGESVEILEKTKVYP